MNLPENTPQPDNLPVANSGDLSASTFPAALATCAADAFIAPTVAEFNARLADGIRGIEAKTAWLDIYITLPNVRPQLN